MNATVIAIETVAPKLVKLTAELDNTVDHRAGQYTVFSIDGVEGQAYYSIASIPADQPHLTFLIRLGDSALDVATAALSVGDRLNISDPAGNFAPASDGDALIFVGGGTGIAPLLAMLRQLVADNDPRRLRLVYGIRGPEELSFEEELEALRQAGVNVRIVEGEPVQLMDHDLAGIAPRLHLCGSKAMIEALSTQANEAGVDRIITEFGR